MQTRRFLFMLGTLAISACNCESGSLVDVRPLLITEPEGLDFGQVPVTDLRIRSFKLQNKGGATLTITRFELRSTTTEFIFASPVPEALGAEQSLDFNVVYQPEDVGEDSATIVVDSNDGKGEHLITLHGIGIAADVVATHDGERCGTTDSSLSFGRVVPGRTVERSITVKATGSAPVSILSIVVDPGTSGEFSIDPLPGEVSLAPGQELGVRARYAPIDGGPDSGAFVITTNAASNPSIRISVCGEGVAPAICASPVPLDLGGVPPGSSVSGTLRLESCGLEPVDLSAIRLSSDAQHPTDSGFRLLSVPSMPQTLAPGMAVDVSVEFTAAQIARADGWVQVTSTSYGRPENHFPVVARGAQPCGILVAPTTITFSGVAVGSTAQRAVLVANNGASTCMISRANIAIGGSVFRLSPPPQVPLAIPAAGSAMLQVEYAPVIDGVQDDGTLEIVENGVVTPVILTGNPQPEDGCQIEVVPAFVNFGVVPPNTTRSMGITVSNLSSDPCFLRGTSLDPASDPDFSNTSPSFGLIFPGMSKSLSVTYRPTASGSATGTLHIETNDVDTPMFDVPLFASSAPTGICVDPRHLPFGPTPGTSTMEFTIYACGGRSVTVTALDWTTPDTEMMLLNPPPLPLTLAAGANQAVTVQYQSQDMDGDTAVVTVRSDDLAEPEIDVTATGGPEIVPASAGRFLYYWQIPSILGGDIMQLPLQGQTQSIAFWGPRAGKQCTGCHNVSPDGRYVAVIEASNFAGFRMIDTQTNIALALPNQNTNAAFLSWNPDVNTNPPYQYVYDDTQDLHIAALFDGYIGKVPGADTSTFLEQMPSWGPNGKIAFARGTQQAQGNNGQGTWGFNGPTDIMVIDSTGGTPVPIPGASGNMMANYYPAFSRNGLWIAFTESASAESTIAAADAQIRLAKADLSGTVSSLPQANGSDGASSYPTWSVDGAFLSFSSNRAGGEGDWDIYIAPIDPNTGADGAATNVRQANTSAFEHSAQWSP